MRRKGKEHFADSGHWTVISVDVGNVRLHRDFNDLRFFSTA